MIFFVCRPSAQSIHPSIHILQTLSSFFFLPTEINRVYEKRFPISEAESIAIYCILSSKDKWMEQDISALLLSIHSAQVIAYTG